MFKTCFFFFFKAYQDAKSLMKFFQSSVSYLKGPFTRREAD